MKIYVLHNRIISILVLLGVFSVNASLHAQQIELPGGPSLPRPTQPQPPRPTQPQPQPQPSKTGYGLEGFRTVGTTLTKPLPTRLSPAKRAAINGIKGAYAAFKNQKALEINELNRKNAKEPGRGYAEQAAKLREIVAIAKIILSVVMNRIASCQFKLDDNFKNNQLGIALQVALAGSPNFVRSVAGSDVRVNYPKILNELVNDMQGYMDDLAHAESADTAKKSRSRGVRATVNFLGKLEAFGSKF